jgi:16S rRNA (adenine1518-N6/adenine1519-N6)-dimethyltransferase
MTSLYQRTRALAEEAGIRPSRRLGQSFLVEGAVARQIVEAAAVSTGEWVLEIGPGLGALTFELDASGVPTVAIERDRRLAALLRKRLGPFVQLVVMDATRLDWDRLGRRPPVLVSNLPYPITSDTLLSLCQSPPPVRRALLMLQREVAERIAAGPGSSERSSLSVLVQLHFRLRTVLKAPPQCFWPRPDVHSAVVELVPHQPGRSVPGSLRRVLKAGFGQRRKTLANALGRPADVLELSGLPPRVRAQDLSNEDWLSLASLLE